MRSCVASALTLVWACLACTPTPAISQPESTARVEPAAKLEPEVIPVLGLEFGLPQPPAFAQADVPVLASDNTWSVRGLRSVREQLLPEAEADRVVLVSAYVQEVYAAPQCPEGELCPPGKQPHAWVVDDPGIRGKQGALMVVDVAFPIPEWDEQTLAWWADEPELVLNPGQRYVFAGWFRRFSDSGFAHDQGLLVLFAVTDHPIAADSRWLVPRNSEQHPKARAQRGLEPMQPELAQVPAGVVPGDPMPALGPLIEPRDRGEAATLGQAAALANHPRRADYYYRWMIVDDPSHAAGWVALANMYLDNGEGPAGLAIIDLAITRSPNDYSLHNGRGRLLLNAKDPAAAAESYRRALELQPDAADVLFGLGMAYAELGERELAVATLERFLVVAGSGAEVPEHIQRAAQDTIMRMSPGF